MGFDNESILNPERVPLEYFCTLCRHLVYPTEAQQILCGHLLCRSCILCVLGTTRRCPYDNHTLNEADPKDLQETNATLYASLCQIGVCCIYHKSGCSWQGLLADSLGHSMSCFYACSPVFCNKCGKEIMHREVQEHAQTCTGTSVLAQTQQPMVENSQWGQVVVKESVEDQGQTGPAIQQSQPVSGTQVPLYVNGHNQRHYESDDRQHYGEYQQYSQYDQQFQQQQLHQIPSHQFPAAPQPKHVQELKWQDHPTLQEKMETHPHLQPQQSMLQVTQPQQSLRQFSEPQLPQQQPKQVLVAQQQWHSSSLQLLQRELPTWEGHRQQMGWIQDVMPQGASSVEPDEAPIRKSIVPLWQVQALPGQGTLPCSEQLQAEHSQVLQPTLNQAYSSESNRLVSNQNQYNEPNQLQQILPTQRDSLHTLLNQPPSSLSNQGVSLSGQSNLSTRTYPLSAVQNVDSESASGVAPEQSLKSHLGAPSWHYRSDVPPWDTRQFAKASLAAVNESGISMVNEQQWEANGRKHADLESWIQQGRQSLTKDYPLQGPLSTTQKKQELPALPDDENWLHHLPLSVRQAEGPQTLQMSDACLSSRSHLVTNQRLCNSLQMQRGMDSFSQHRLENRPQYNSLRPFQSEVITGLAPARHLHTGLLQNSRSVLSTGGGHVQQWADTGDHFGAHKVEARLGMIGDIGRRMSYMEASQWALQEETLRGKGFNPTLREPGRQDQNMISIQNNDKKQGNVAESDTLWPTKSGDAFSLDAEDADHQIPFSKFEESPVWSEIQDDNQEHILSDLAPSCPPDSPSNSLNTPSRAISDAQEDIPQSIPIEILSRHPPNSTNSPSNMPSRGPLDSSMNAAGVEAKSVLARSEFQDDSQQSILSESLPRHPSPSDSLNTLSRAQVDAQADDLQVIPLEFVSRYPPHNPLCPSSMQARTHANSSIGAFGIQAKSGLPLDIGGGHMFQAEIGLCHDHYAGFGDLSGPLINLNRYSKFSSDLGKFSRLTSDDVRQYPPLPGMGVQPSSVGEQLQFDKPADAALQSVLPLGVDIYSRRTLEMKSRPYFHCDMESLPSFSKGIKSLPGFQSDIEHRPAFTIDAETKPGLPLDTVAQYRLRTTFQGLLGPRPEDFGLSREDLMRHRSEVLRDRPESMFSSHSPARDHVLIPPGRESVFLLGQREHFVLPSYLEGLSSELPLRPSFETRCDTNRFPDLLRMKPINLHQSVFQHDIGWLPQVVDRKFPLASATGPGIGPSSGRVTVGQLPPRHTLHVASYGMLNGDPYSNLRQRMDASKALDQSRKRKQMDSLGWCRICHIDCYNVDGLQHHSQSREHQKKTLDLVMNIKEENEKVKFLADDSRSMAENKELSSSSRDYNRRRT